VTTQTHGTCLETILCLWESNRIKSTQVNSSQIESSQLKSTQLNSTQLNSTQLKLTQIQSQILFIFYSIKFYFYFHRHFVLPFVSFPPYGTLCSTFSIFLCLTFLGLIRCKTYSYKAPSMSLSLTPLDHWSAGRFAAFVPITPRLINVLGPVTSHKPLIVKAAAAIWS